MFGQRAKTFFEFHTLRRKSVFFEETFLSRAEKQFESHKPRSKGGNVSTETAPQGLFLVFFPDSF